MLMEMKKQFIPKGTVWFMSSGEARHYTAHAASAVPGR